MMMDDTTSQASTEPQAPVAEAQPAVVAAPVKPSPKPKASAAERTAPKPQPFKGTGRRKEAIARVRLAPGNGTILVNAQPCDRYFPREALRVLVRQPLVVTHQLGKQNVMANVEGGGIVGQAGAVRLGIARALTALDPALKTLLRSAGLLTRDPREKERKKYGQKGARKRFQWTKR